MILAKYTRQNKRGEKAEAYTKFGGLFVLSRDYRSQNPQTFIIKNVIKHLNMLITWTPLIFLLPLEWYPDPHCTPLPVPWLLSISVLSILDFGFDMACL